MLSAIIAPRNSPREACLSDPTPVVDYYVPASQIPRRPRAVVVVAVIAMIYGILNFIAGVIESDIWIDIPANSPIRTTIESRPLVDDILAMVILMSPVFSIMLFI